MDSRLEADVEFAPTDFAQDVKRLVDQGFLRGASRKHEVDGRRELFALQIPDHPPWCTQLARILI